MFIRARVPLRASCVFPRRACLASAAPHRNAYWPALEYDCDISLVEVVDEQWPQDELARRVKEIGLQVVRNFATPEEQDAIVRELEDEQSGPLKKLKWESGHWDAVIEDYRECERWKWTSPEARRVVKRMKAKFPSDWQWRPTHILDLKGSIGPHVDAVHRWRGCVWPLVAVTRSHDV